MAAFIGCTAGKARTDGVEKLGHRGVIRTEISGKVSRFFTRSTPGGWAVSEAAAKMMVNPIPISASEN
jgi:hypothetical protein